MVNLCLSEGDFMERLLFVTMLYDFYGELLTDKQKDVFEKHYLEDLSLNEIGQEKGTTRQAVLDAIKRSEKLLFEYEQKLCLVDKFISRKEKIEQIRNELDRLSFYSADSYYFDGRIALIKKLLSEILD